MPKTKSKICSQSSCQGPMILVDCLLHRPFNSDEEALFVESAQFAYKSFRDKAAASRNMSIEDMQVRPYISISNIHTKELPIAIRSLACYADTPGTPRLGGWLR